MTVQKGDTITFEGIRQMARNPDRKWWQVWKPRLIPANAQWDEATLIRFKARDVAPLALNTINTRVGIICGQYKAEQRAQNKRLSDTVESIV